MKTVLIIAEAVTLAHVVRGISIAQSLAAEPYKIILAFDKRMQGAEKYSFNDNN